MRTNVHAYERILQWHKTYDTADVVKYNCPCVISGFPREVDENCALLGYYTASSGNLFPTFRDKLLVPSSEFIRLVIFVKLKLTLYVGNIADC